MQIGNITPNPKRDNPQAYRVYDKEGIAPILNCMEGGNRQPIIVASRGRNKDNPSDRTPGNEFEQRLEPNSQGISNTLTTVQKDNLLLETQYRIRKLTPLECWRLMGFTDEDFYSAMVRSKSAANEILETYPNHHGKRIMTEMERVQRMSNSQLYKQAGNSIVVNVLEAIFSQMM